MFYIIVEGEQGKLAHTFWSEINKQLLNGKAKVVGVPGSLIMYYKTIKDIVKQLNITNRHSLLLVFDKAPGDFVYLMMEDLERLFKHEINNGKQLKISYTQEFCFEEWLLSSTEQDLINSNNYRSFIKECCDNNQNWAKTPRFTKFIQEYGNGHTRNREQSDSILLHKLSTRKNAEITKGKLGICWMGDPNNTCEWKKHGKCNIECRSRILDGVNHTNFSADSFKNGLMQLYNFCDLEG